MNSTQKDLNEFCQSAGNDGGLGGCASSDANLTWTWDDTGWTGANTGDACALYDTDGDGNANFALCVTVQSDPAVQSSGSPRFYSCDNSKALNCGGSTLITAASSCTVSNVADAFTGAHGGGNVCTGTNCSTKDTQAQCCVKHGDFPSGSAAELIDVCSYSSSSPSSSPSECVKAVLCTNDSDCSELNDACNTGKCATDGLTKSCVATPKTDGTTCDDGSACTQSDTCQSGICAGNSIICTASDQCHDAGTCDPQTGTCSNPVKPSGTSCSDGDACTGADGGDHCDANGQCVPGAAVTCTASDQCHDAGTCDPQTGTCSNPSKANGSSCSDGNACTQSDVCQSGICTGGNPVTCTAADQCHDAGTCNPQTGACSQPAKPSGTSCSDGNACTGADGGDHCDANGQCVPGAAVVCSALDQCHDAGTCNPQTGACSQPAKPSGTSCSDGNACTGADGGDHCDANGQCVPGAAVVCSALDQCHDAGTCNPQTGACSQPTKPSGTSCSDGNACTGADGGDHCDANGQCAPGAAVVCSALDQCHDAGTCNPQTGACSQPAKPSGTSCSDGNACTGADGGDRCDANGQCVPGAAVACSALDQCHDAGTCNPQTGACSQPAKPSGTSCSDGDACTGAGGENGDRCDANGQCVPGTAVVCSAPDQCHDAGTCDPQTGTCSHPAKPSGAACSDGDACTLADTCDGAGACIAGNPRDCTPDDPCRQSSTCDSASGECVVTAKAVNCDDAVCSEDPSCLPAPPVEICDNCIDDNGDGLVDRDDPECAPMADGAGAGIGDPRLRGKSATKCQATMRSAGLRLAQVTRKRLQQCSDAVFKCIQQQPDDASCLEKARTRCAKLAAALTGGAKGLVAKTTTKISKSCGPKKAGLPPRVSREDLCAPSGLGFGSESAACDDTTLSTGDVLDAVTDHLVHEHRCRVAQLFAASVPRGGELLMLGDFGVSAAECVDYPAVADSLGLESPKTVGKAAVKCQKTIGASATRFLQKVVGAYQRCSAAMFTCVQQKPDDSRCRPKAEARCQKLTGALFHDPKSAEGQLRKTIAKACGPSKSGTTLDLADIRAAAGLGYDDMESRCSALGVSGLDSLDDIDECVIREHVCRAQQVLTSEMPRTHELLEMGGALLR